MNQAASLQNIILVVVPRTQSLMGTSNLVVLLPTILISYFLLTTAQQCANSTYGKIRNQILSSLASNVTANGGFYTATHTLDSDTVYALALCRGDLANQSCFDCVNSSSHVIMASCPTPDNKAATDYGASSHCIFRCSDKSFFASMDTQPTRLVYVLANIMENFDEFYVALRDLADGLITRAANGSSSLKLATGEKNYTKYDDNVYGLMQCIPGLTSLDCSKCLSGAMDDYRGCCLRYRAVNIMKPSCIFQYDLSPFLESSVGAAPPPPPPVTIARPPPQPPANTSGKAGKNDNTTRAVIIVVLTTTSLIALIVCICIFLRKRKQKKKPNQKGGTEDEISTVESLQYDFETINVATDNFSDTNKLGQGGFGAVYKGRLPNGQEIAVKRLSTNSGQGELEFKNEVILVAKLQHRNLVRLLGFCLEGIERLLIYEFVTNSSLDHFIFDPIKRAHLDWDRRYKIIGGIARGLLYLHEESRLRIIHRDLKASNVLLDAEMNPRISDFGMARLFVMDETQGNTSRVVGTYGYMAPEYAMHGHFSVKSDVFSFGVLVLEIVSGQKNNYYRNGENVEDFLSYAWKSWKEGTTSNLIDPILRCSGSMREMMRCIHIGLLCVQENVAERPTMASVVLMLSSLSLSLGVPSEPAFFLHSRSVNPEVDPLLHSISQ